MAKESRAAMSVWVVLFIVLLAAGGVFGKDTIRLIATARDGGSTWNYLESERRMTSWKGLTFNDKKWKSGASGFGNRNNGGLTKTPWSGGRKDLYLRKEFKCDFKAKDIEKAELTYAIDDSVEIWLNGKPIFSMEYNGHYEYNTADVTEEFRRLVRESGRSNIVAVKAHDNGGECYVDVGLMVNVEESDDKGKKVVSSGRDSGEDRGIDKPQVITKSQKNKTSTSSKDGLVELGKICNTEGLVHCWRFNGDLKDCVGGGEAMLVDGATVNGHQVDMAEGQNYVYLGRELLPRENMPVTIEIWAMARSFSDGSRILKFGRDKWTRVVLHWYYRGMDMLEVIRNNEKLAALRPVFGSLMLNKEYHLSLVMNPRLNGCWDFTVYSQDSKTGETLSKSTITVSGNWSFSDGAPNDFWLGRSFYGNGASDSSYNEVRIWNRALDEQELTQNAINFHKAGETMKTSGEPRRFVGGGNSSSGRETRQQSKLSSEELKKIIDAENAYDKKMLERKFGKEGQR